MFSLSAQRISFSFRRRLARALNGLQRRAVSQAGFSMPEILAVLVIISVLAAVAVGVFASQSAKAVDAQAKEMARTADTTAHMIASENSGVYNTLSPAELNSHEPSLGIAESRTAPWVTKAQGSGDEYEITIKAPNGDEFEIGRNSSGEITRTCTGCTPAGQSSW